MLFVVNYTEIDVTNCKCNSCAAFGFYAKVRGRDSCNFQSFQKPFANCTKHLIVKSDVKILISL